MNNSINLVAAAATTPSGLDSITGFLQKVPGWLQSIGTGVSVIMIGVACILMMTGREGSQKAKVMIAFILIAVAILYLAAEFVNTVKNAA